MAVSKYLYKLICVIVTKLPHVYNAFDVDFLCFEIIFLTKCFKTI